MFRYVPRYCSECSQVTTGFEQVRASDAKYVGHWFEPSIAHRHLRRSGLVLLREDLPSCYPRVIRTDAEG
ncbi:hypothetical protein GCM10009576_098790 [Streptomyces rhizosphaericus]|uniref:Uncharacterized protein n=1 Tax=Streptomyces rhizosphaericus TaxID=114699 RepID=A0ABN1SVW9_9ACTN